MSFVLRNAQLVDGTGAPARRADVRVDGDRITAVGTVARDPDVAEVDLTGLTLAPGFIDIRTHYDAQVLWDGALSPSCCLASLSARTRTYAIATSVQGAR